MAFDFSPYQAVLIDLDGTLYKEDHPLPGAARLVRRLLAEGRKLATLSNSTQSPQRIAKRLAAMEMALPDHLIFTAAEEAVEYCLREFVPRPRLFNLSTEGVHDLLDGKVTWVAAQDQPCDAVVIGNPAGFYATPPRQRIALRLLCAGAACLGLCEDRVYPSPDGLEIGSGAMTWMLAFAANVKPIFFGKPRQEFFQSLCDRLNVNPQDCILIGDNLESDIAGAAGVGMKTILSLTGVAKKSDLDKLPHDRRPNWVVESLEELGE